MKRLIAIVALLVAVAAVADTTGVPASGITRRFIRLSGAPASCAEGDAYYDLTAHIDYVCTTAGTPGTWTARGTGSGTVTSVGNGTIGPLFSASWATATTTPALSLNLTTQAANLHLLGPTSGGAAVPTFRALVDADLGSFALNASFKTITVQPVTDVITATFRRDGAAQTSHFVDLQDESNNVLSFFDKTGVFNGNVIGNLTGNASTVTTNANLTGPITSTGNATAIASQTGTGTKFVMDTAPTFATTVQVTGNVGLGTSPSGTAGLFLTTSDSANEATIIQASNTNAAGTSAQGVLRASADTALLNVNAHGTARALTRYGVTIGGYNEIDSLSGNGLLIGTRGAAPTIIGANSIAGLRFDGTTAVPSLPLAGLTAGAMTVTNNAVASRTVTRFDWTNAMVTALGGVGAGDITVCTLPAKTVVINAYVVIDTPDTSANALTVAVGRTSATFVDYIVASDAKAAANTVYGDASGERGTNLTGFDLPSVTGTTAVKAHFVKTTTNLSTVVGSTGHIYLVTEVLP